MRTKYYILDKVRKYDPTKNIVANAINHLTDRTEIELFLEDYIEFLRTEFPGPDKRGSTAEIALSNIQFMLGHYGDETIEKWYSIIPELEEFALGRRLVPYDDGEDLSKKLKTRMMIYSP